MAFAFATASASSSKEQIGATGPKISSVRHRLPSGTSLYAPPVATRWLAGNGANWERAGALLFPALGGVHVVEAKKSIYAMTPLPAEASVATPVLSPEISRFSSEGR